VAPAVRRYRKTLGGALSALVSQIDVELPEYLPVLGYGFCTEGLSQKPDGS